MFYTGLPTCIKQTETDPLTPSQLALTAPRGISALPGPVGKADLLTCRSADLHKTNRDRSSHPQSADADSPEGHLGPTRVHCTALHNTFCINTLQDMRAAKREHAYLVKHCILIIYESPTKLLREEVGAVGDDAVELTLRDGSGIVQSPDTGTVAHVMEP